MSSVIEIEKAIEKLTEPDQRKFAERFGEHRLLVEASSMLGGIYDDENTGENQLIEDEEG